jgi:drug/metabolite transporter (DMT)-like permease
VTDASKPVAKENFPAVKAIAPFAFLALLGGNAALAAGPLFVRLADVGPVAAGFWRLALALPVLLFFAYRQGVFHFASTFRSGNGAAGWGGVRNALGLAAIGGLFFAADLASWHLGILQTKMANATLFGNAASLILAATTLVLARRLPVRTESTALLLAFAGAILLMRESGHQGEARLIGDLLCLLAGVLYAGYMLTMQRARGTLASWPTLALSTAAGVLPLLLFAMLLGERILPGDWRPVVALAFTSQIVGQGLLIYALPHFSALVVGLTLLTQPVMAATIGWLVYGERLSPVELIGGAMVAAALVLVRLPAGPRNRSS